MSKKEKIHDLINLISMEVHSHIKEKESTYPEGWVPAAEIKKELELNFISVPAENSQQRPTGWFFGVITRILEDKGSIEYKRIRGRAFYRSK